MGKEEECQTEATKIVRSLEHTIFKKLREIGFFSVTQGWSDSILQLLERNLWLDGTKLFPLEENNIKRSNEHLLQLGSSD